MKMQALFETTNTALVQFAMLHRRLPCPANGLATSGTEDVTSPTDTVSCLSPSGVVPWTTLGLAQSAVIDPWGRLIGYRVYDRATGFTQTTGMAMTDCQDEDGTSIIPSAICDAANHGTTTGDVLSGKGLTVNDWGTAKTQVAYVLISFGPTGLGGYPPSSNAPMSAPSSASKEFQNAGSGGTYWSMQASSNLAAEDDNHFDDLVSYSSAAKLVSDARIGGKPWPISEQPASANVTAATPWSKDFRVTRTYLKIKLDNFATSGPNTDKAQIKYYRDAMQVAQQTISACNSGGGAYGQFTLQPGADFTRFEIVGINATPPPNFNVASIAGCKYTDALHPPCNLPNPGASDCPYP